MVDLNDFERMALLTGCEYGYAYLESIRKAHVFAFGEKGGVTGDEYEQFAQCIITGYIEELTRANGMMATATQRVQVNATPVPTIITS